jgi:bacillithiol biosynthesis cysteine-adding enzyme BshC
LSAEGFPAVPLFWVASEDHDFQEIRETTFLDRESELLELRLEDSAGHPLTAAQRLVGEQKALTQRLGSFLRGLDHAGQVLEWIEQSYRAENSLSEAFARLLASVLGSHGLVLLDASDPVLRMLSSRHYLRAVEQAERVDQLQHSRIDELRAAGFEPQAHWEKNYTLLFHLDSSGRYAIRRSNGEFSTEERHWTVEELRQEMEKDPEHFSPSALLRPVVQDAVLPAAFYVGGPAEIAYFAQVQALSEVYGWVPVIQPRLSVTLLDPRACRYLERNQLEVADLFCSLEELQQKIALNSLQPDVFAEWNERSKRARHELDSIFDVAARVDPTVANAWKTSRKKIDYQLEKTQKKLLKAVAGKNQLVKSQGSFLHNLVYPDEVLQERRINFFSFYARYGPALIQKLFSLSPCERFSHVVTLQ